jgi:uncharacterized protein YbcI
VVEHLRCATASVFFWALGSERQESEQAQLNATTDFKPDSGMAQQIAEAVGHFQKHSTGYSPKAVTVVLSKDTLVITLHEALTPAERELSKSAAGAAQVQEFHRQLFANSSQTLRATIHRITGRQVREATAEVEPTTGAIVHAFTTGTVVQVFLLTGNGLVGAGSNDRSEPSM